MLGSLGEYTKPGFSILVAKEKIHAEKKNWLMKG